MRNKKRIENLEEKLDDIVFCEKCGVAIQKSYAHKISIEEPGNGLFAPWQIYYCQEHKKPYDSIYIQWDICKDSDGNCYCKSRKEYFKSSVEVNKKGKLINN